MKCTRYGFVEIPPGVRHECPVCGLAIVTISGHTRHPRHPFLCSRQIDFYLNLKSWECETGCLACLACPVI